MPAKTSPVLLLKTDKNGTAYPTLQNVYTVLRNHDMWIGVLRHNELTGADEYHGDGGDHDPLGIGAEPRPLSDVMGTEIRLWLEVGQAWTRAPSKDVVWDALQAVAAKRPYHPVRDYLAPLAAAWDGTERLSLWLEDFCEAEGTEYVRAVARKSLIGCVARAFEAGCKLDTMPVLVGPQGVKKSSLIRMLGREWTTDTPVDPGSKDAYEAIMSSWLVEFAELAGMTGRDVERLKAFFSSPVDTYRPPYARKTVSRPRCCAFWGTTNSREFLKDSSGSRRFWCVEVGDINLDGLEPVLDQLWGEAVSAYMLGESWWMSPEEAELARNEAEQFSAVDPWEDTIVRRLGAETDWVFTSDLYDLLELAPKDQHPGTSQRIVRIMCERLGWHRPRHALRRNGRRGHGFSRNKLLVSGHGTDDGTEF